MKIVNCKSNTVPTVNKKQEEGEFKQSDPGQAWHKMVVLVSLNNSISKWYGVFALHPLFADRNDCFIKHIQNQFLYTQAGHTSSLLPDSP